MATHKIALEFKDRHLSRPELDGIVGASLRTNPDAKELIVRCRSATKTAKKAADTNSYPIKVTLVAREITE